MIINSLVIKSLIFITPALTQCFSSVYNSLARDSDQRIVPDMTSTKISLGGKGISKSAHSPISSWTKASFILRLQASFGAKLPRKANFPPTLDRWKSTKLFHLDLQSFDRYLSIHENFKALLNSICLTSFDLHLASAIMSVRLILSPL